MSRISNFIPNSGVMNCFKSSATKAQTEAATQSIYSTVCMGCLDSLKGIFNVLLNPLTSATFGALGPVFNKQVVVSSEPSEDTLLALALKYSVYPIATQITLNAVFIVLMLTVNTLSVKYKMLSFKYSGSFISTAVIFSVSSFLSLMFDMIVSSLRGDGIPANLPRQLIALTMICLGVTMTASQSSHAKPPEQRVPESQIESPAANLPTEGAKLSGVCIQPSERSSISAQVDDHVQLQTAAAKMAPSKQANSEVANSKASCWNSVEERFWANKTLDPSTEQGVYFEMSVLHKSAGELGEVSKEPSEPLGKFNKREVELQRLEPKIRKEEVAKSKGTFEP